MKMTTKLAAAALISAGALAFTATGASADVVCNDSGDCWHVHNHYDYHPDWHLVVHPDGWAWADADHDHYRWHEPDGDDRGYWHDGVWIKF
jgi:hypothetical protein